ncbi:TAXI family TRAP transporter solute-binding subunit [Arthrobacter sp. M4]|uniref:TAXI family TRAP transporter solute-binding subunit n=1 Tax=Arthrobacter sp. M4 TaxID=218160 RepID=UPI001CDD5E4E|nr:TAXI family TRAP transporter solute-binding subunit [Arthrobacter sp. M4]MCA4134376.1 TAXI family TRAP transporter solute-binding subunit [Arthrobacter sp. M4]
MARRDSMPRAVSLPKETHSSASTARRTALKAGLSVALSASLGGLLISTTSSCTAEPRPGKITVAGGETGGFYLEFATLVAKSMQRHGVADTAEPLVTGGSLENMERLLAGEATFAVALADAAAQKAATQTQPAGGGGIVALGRVYENYVHCVVRKDSGIQSFSNLAGKTAAIGEAGSGTSLTAQRIVSASGLSAPIGEQPMRQVILGLNQGLAALRDGAVDALFWSGGVPTAAIAAANRELGLRFVDLSALIAATRARFGAYYDRVLIPEGSYEGSPGVWTVGVANLLLCRADLDDLTVRKTVELLVNRAEELIPKSSLGVQFLSPDTLINTAGVPLHPAAAAAYRSLHG